MSIKAAILDKNEGEEVEKSEYTNLIMDDMEIKLISAEDREFLEGFAECQFLSLNSTKLETLDNMPAMQKLERLEICENLLGGPDLGTNLARLYPNLVTIKLSQNKIETVEEIAGLSALVKLESLDLSDNPIVTTLGDDYQMKVRAVLGEKLEVLDCLNKLGEEVVSDEDESEVDEEGEGDEEEDGSEGEEGEDGEEADEDQDGGKGNEATGDASVDTMVTTKRAKTEDDAPELPAEAAAH